MRVIGGIPGHWSKSCKRSTISLGRVAAIVGLALGTSSAIASAGVVHHTANARPASKKAPAGLPNLRGVTINLGKAAGNPAIEDTVSYIMPQLLRRWGATVNYTLGAANLPSAVVAGQLQATGGLLAAVLNSGLRTFGPSMAKLDYVLIANRSITSIKQLKGKSFPISDTNSEDDVLTETMLGEAHLSVNAVNYIVTGSGLNDIAEFVAHRVPATWVSIGNLNTLKAQNVPYRVLTNSSQVAPWAMDSVEMATAKWLEANPRAAEAIDLAWLYGAHIFNTNKSLFISYAAAYTKGVFSKALITLDRSEMLKANLFPTGPAVFSSVALERYISKIGSFSHVSLKVPASTPIANWAIFSAWKAAQKVYNEDPNAFG